MRLIFLFVFFVSMNLGAQKFTGSYPNTKVKTVKYNHENIRYSDPYHWLEDDLAEDTKQWVTAQNKVAFKYLDQIPYRNQIKNQMTSLWNYEKIGTPFLEGDYSYYYKNSGLQQHSVLYRKKNGKEEIFLDPNTFSKDKTTSMPAVRFSKDGSLVAYMISEGGSDWRKVIVMDAESKQIIGDTIQDVKFSNIAWHGNLGFYYSSYDKPKNASELSAKTNQHKLYFHQLNTPQSKDQLIFGGEKTPRRYISAYLTEDERFLVITAANSTTNNELYVQDLAMNNSQMMPIVTGFDTECYVVDNQYNELFIHTNYKAPNNRLVKVSANNPNRKNWQDVIPENEHVLNLSKANGYFFAHYLVDAVDQIKQYDYQGNKIRDIQLPEIGSASGFSGKANQETIYYSFTNYKHPNTSFSYNTKTGKSKIYQEPKINFNPQEFTSKQIFYTSFDGTKIPMVVTHKKGLTLNGKNPTILYGYGGFNISLTPRFSIPNAVWMQNGGIYAVANLRGGGEYGKAWHDAGTKQNKKNVFKDFIAAAKYLHKNKYTSPKYTALSGRSNGGLLVGATMTMNPTIAQVALPGVGVLDMLRYHKFTAGAGWAYDYGTIEESKEMANYLRSYSPVHNVKQNVCYPATMITTADHDDRVVPAHSFKFAAELQSKQSCQNPTIIRIDTKAGHGPGKSTEMKIAEATDEQAFALFNMGIESL